MACNDHILAILTPDYPLLRKAQRHIFKSAEHLLFIGEAAHVPELMEIAAELLPDFNLTKFRRQCEEKNKAAETMAAGYLSDCKVVILKLSDHLVEITRMLQGGAKCYIINSPSVDISPLVEAFNEEYVFKTKQRSSCKASAGKDSRYPARPESVKSITPKELIVLKLLCDQLCAKEIASQMGIDVRTVETHKQNLCRKHNCRNIAGLVICAIKYGHIQLSIISAILWLLPDEMLSLSLS